MIGALSTSDPAADRRLNLLLAASIATALLMLVGGVIAVPKILSSASTTKAVARGNELTACRATARAEVDDAAARLQSARALLDTLTNQGLEAAARQDRAALRALVAELAPAREAVVAQAGQLDATTSHYKTVVALSRDDPTKFLNLCRSGDL